MNKSIQRKTNLLKQEVHTNLNIILSN